MQKVDKLSGCGIFKIARITSVSLDSEEILKMAWRYRAALRVIYTASKATPQRLREIAYRAFMHDDNKPLPNKKRVRLTPEMKRCLALIEPQGFIVDASPKDIAIYMKDEDSDFYVPRGQERECAGARQFVENAATNRNRAESRGHQ